MSIYCSAKGFDLLSHRTTQDIVKYRSYITKLKGFTLYIAFFVDTASMF